MGSMFEFAVSFNNGFPSGVGNTLGWNTAMVQNMSRMFTNASAFNQIIRHWNTGNVTTMQSMFSGASRFNQLIDQWVTHRVTDMSLMFQNAVAFNQNINTITGNRWNTQNVTDMSWMFQGATNFNGIIRDWNTVNVTNMTNMFNGASSFNQSFNLNANVHTRLTIREGGTDWQQRIINNDTSFNNAQRWGIDSQWFDPNFQPSNQVALQFRFFIAYVTTLYGISSGEALVFTIEGFRGQELSFIRTGVSSYSATFAGTTQIWTYNLPITVNPIIWNTVAWNTVAVTNMSHMFSGATSFNSDIRHWRTVSVTDMSFMFNGATIFNQNIGNWLTFRVRNMSEMFRDAITFNQPIDDWNTMSVTGMSNMFNNARDFNQSIGGWITVNVTNMNGMFQNTVAFNRPIGTWNTVNVTNMARMFFNAVNFNNGTSPWLFHRGFLNSAEENNFFLFNRQVSLGGRTLNWNTSNVTDMSDIFNGARNFINTTLINYQAGSRSTVTFEWNIRSGAIVAGFRRNCPLPDHFTPRAIVNSANGGR